jgi:hypothetical protein
MPELLIHKTSPEETARLDQVAALAEQDRAGLIAQIEQQQLAAMEPTFGGLVRRAILSMEVPCRELADLAGVDRATFDAFRSGEVDLPLPAFERVARRLGFQLVRGGPITG